MLLSLGTNKTSSEIRGDRQQANSLRASRQSHAATVSESLAGQAPHPDAAGGRLAEMNFMAPHGKRHRFIIFALMFSRARSRDRKSTRLNSSHGSISYAVFCLKKKKKQKIKTNRIIPT